VRVTGIAIRMEGKEFEKIGVPFDNGAHLLCRANGMQFAQSGARRLSMSSHRKPPMALDSGMRIQRTGVAI